jgi:enoyl-CoA hydratase/carnithine racemase
VTEEVVVRQEGGAVRLVLNRPDALNALTNAMLDALLAQVASAGERPEVRCLVLQGAGPKGFCSGIDLAERQGLDAAGKARQSRRVLDLVTALRGSPKPSIAALHGFCLGAGLEIALACDLRIAEASARLGFPETTLGAYPGGGGAVLLPRLIGRARAMSWLLSGKRIDAAEAERIGLLARAVPEGGLEAAVAECAVSIERMAPLAVAALKRSIDATLDVPFEQAIALDQALRRPLDDTDDYREALLAFREKRAPVFKGR